jgi:hypothetical protein
VEKCRRSCLTTWPVLACGRWCRGRAGAATPLSRVERDAQRARRPPRRVPTQRLDAEPRRQRVGQRPRQHPSGAQSTIATNLRVGEKSKCMRDRNLRMSGSRETRVALGSIEVRSRLPAGGSEIRTLGPPPPGAQRANSRTAGENLLRGVPARSWGRGRVVSDPDCGPVGNCKSRRRAQGLVNDAETLAEVYFLEINLGVKAAPQCVYFENRGCGLPNEMTDFPC